MKADVALLRLPAPSLRGTFAKAYSLLTKLVAKIGWDELLKCRSSVFVMEEEYRMQKAAEEERKSQKIVNTSPPQEKEIKSEEAANAKTNGVNDLSQSVQTISISGDLDGDDSENTKEKGSENADEKAVSNHEVTNGRDENDNDEKENSNLKIADGRSLNSENMEEVDLDDNPNNKSKSASVIEFKGPELEKPLQAANEDKSDNQSIHNDDQSKVLNMYSICCYSCNN